jgi:outer membrane immunogenic protein
MKRGAIVSISVLALTGTAMAADLSAPRYTKAPALPVGVPEWAGWYVGVQGGVAQSKSTFNDPDQLVAQNGGSFDVSKTGGVFGGNVGYNWQSGNVVWGLETDLNWVGAKGQSATASNWNGPWTQSGEVSWMGSFRGRLGFDYMSTLFYATGGLAYGGVKNSVAVPDFPISFVDDKTPVQQPPDAPRGSPLHRPRQRHGFEHGVGPDLPRQVLQFSVDRHDRPGIQVLSSDSEFKTRGSGTACAGPPCFWGDRTGIASAPCAGLLTRTPPQHAACYPATSTSPKRRTHPDRRGSSCQGRRMRR